MHPLLRRQLLKLGLSPAALPPEWQGFVRDVDETYDSVQADRLMLERTLDLSSQELLEANQEARASEELIRSTLQSTADAILAIDKQGNILVTNDRFLELTGDDGAGLKLPTVEERLNNLAQQFVDPEGFTAGVRAMRNSDAESFDVLKLVDGRVVERYSRPMKDRTGISGRVWSLRDITQRYLLEEQLRHQAFHDDLTGLANRARFLDRLELAVERSQRAASSVFVLFMDIDDFKAVNDTLGHTIGDETLRGIGDRIRALLRPGDTAARLGGDEFSLLLEDVPDLQCAQEFADELLAAIRAPLQIEGHEIVLHASIGIVEGDARRTPEEMLRNADIAMYVAKKQGKARAQVYIAGMHTNVRERHEMISELRHAVDRQELVVLYQPTIRLADGSASGAEALVRWNHPTRGLIAPDTFVPLAEDTGLISRIGEFVLQEACQVLAEWQCHPETRHLQMNVNVSAKQIHDAALVGTVRDAIHESRLAPGGLTLEITETAMIEDPDRCLETLQDLKRLGVNLALDDFGTGYSSISYLRRFPIDVLKIDKSFIDDLDLSERETLLTSATIAFGKQLALKIVAEGIESVEQLDRLKELGCEFGQGYLFSHPLTRDDLSSFIGAACTRLAA